MILELIKPRRVRRKLNHNIFKRQFLMVTACLFVFYIFIAVTTDSFQTTFGGSKKESEIIGAIIGGRQPTTEIDLGDPLVVCKDWFNDTFEENFEILKHYPRGIGDMYLWKIGGNKSQPDQILTSFPVIVTAASSGFYPRSLSLLLSIYKLLLPRYKNIKVIYYDMGLNDALYNELVEHCTICEVRRFPFEYFPPHVRQLHTYTWKPIIIQMMLMEFGFVWWADTSVRFLTGDLDDALEYSRQYSILSFTYSAKLAIAYHTSKLTMKYLGEDPCKYRYFGENEAGFLLFHYDEISRVLVNTWAACALTKQCMCPFGTEQMKRCSNVAKDAVCHRFDQSIFSILFRRLYHEQNDYPIVEVPLDIHEINRHSPLRHFPIID